MNGTVNWRELPETPYKPLAELSRRMSAESCVLLKNDNNVLPLEDNENAAIFGRCQIDYMKCGLGSGGLVRTEYVVNILDGMQNSGKVKVYEPLANEYREFVANNPLVTDNGMYKYITEYVPDDETIKKAAEENSVAIIVIGRTIGEGCDTEIVPNQWYLSAEEETLLQRVTSSFKKTVVLINSGSIMDMSWVDKYKPNSVMYIWQGGQEGGNAVADALCGNVAPSGKLTDTIAKDIYLIPSTKSFGNKDFNIYSEDIYVGYRYFETFAKDDVLYPFGFGLTYTDFDFEVLSTELINDEITAKVKVKNIGKYRGRQVIQMYFEAPQGALGRPVRELCSFAKTVTLSPDDEEILTLKCNVAEMAAYDDSGVTGNRSCYVLEAGEYNIYIGTDVRSAGKCYSFGIDELRVVKQLSEVIAPTRKFKIMHPVINDGQYTVGIRDVATRTVDYNSRIAENMPNDIEYTGDKGIKLIDVKNGKNTMDEFVAQLTDFDLACMMKGEGMCSPKVRAGSTGAVGGLTKELADFGIPVIDMHDGPSGIRFDNTEKATLILNGTAIASCWDEKLAEQIYSLISVELCTHNADSLLGPGINIHRSPLNGRNFEYLSEDPYLTGKIGAALIRGMAVYGNSATVKHFAANSQETNRSRCDSVMSERALREIYLKGFEISVKEGGATSLMTSYNLINGIWSCNNYELNTVVLREEWGYTGYVMSDWWPTTKKNEEPSEPKNLKDLVAAQNDVFMITTDSAKYNDNIISSLEQGLITRGQLARNAANILRYIINSHTFERFTENGGQQPVALVNDIENLTDAYVLEGVDYHEKRTIDLGKTGKYLICIDYSSDKSPLAQMYIDYYINNSKEFIFVGNGNGNGHTTLYAEAIADKTNMEVYIDYSDEEFKINSVKLKMYQ